MSRERQLPFMIAVVGAGISGLAAAYKLRELAAVSGVPIDVRVFEASSRAGGIIQTTIQDGFILEGGPDSFISEKPDAVNLAKRIGLEAELLQTNSRNRRSFIVRNGRLSAVPEGFHLLAPSLIWPFMTSPIISVSGKMRMAAELLIPKGGSPDESLASFVRRRLGHEALERIAQPMVGGIYTADPELLSLRATMPRFLDLEEKHGSIIRGMIANRRRSKEKTNGTSGPRYSMFLTFRNGMQTLVDRLINLIGRERIELSRAVTSIERADDGWQLEFNNSARLKADAVIVALPAYAAADMLKTTTPELACELAEIPYASTATINVAFGKEQIGHPLNGFGFVVPNIEKRTILACSFSSVKFDGRAPADKVLLRAFVGGALQPEILNLDDSTLEKTVLSELDELIGAKGEPLFISINRWPRSMAQYHVGHLARVQRIDGILSRQSGLQLAGNAYSGAGIPDCIRGGESAALATFQSLSGPDNV